MAPDNEGKLAMIPNVHMSPTNALAGPDPSAVAHRRIVLAGPEAPPMPTRPVAVAMQVAAASVEDSCFAHHVPVGPTPAPSRPQIELYRLLTAATVETGPAAAASRTP